MLFDANTAVLANRMKSHLDDINKLTETTVAGSDHGNMLLVPGERGIMQQLVHHGFACNTTAGFVLAFAHGNLGDSTTSKTLDREDMVEPAVIKGTASC